MPRYATYKPGTWDSSAYPLWAAQTNYSAGYICRAENYPYQYYLKCVTPGVSGDVFYDPASVDGTVVWQDISGDIDYGWLTAYGGALTDIPQLHYGRVVVVPHTYTLVLPDPLLDRYYDSIVFVSADANNAVITRLLGAKITQGYIHPNAEFDSFIFQSPDTYIHFGDTFTSALDPAHSSNSVLRNCDIVFTNAAHKQRTVRLAEPQPGMNAVSMDTCRVKLLSRNDRIRLGRKCRLKDVTLYPGSAEPAVLFTNESVSNSEPTTMPMNQHTEALFEDTDFTWLPLSVRLLELCRYRPADVVFSNCLFPEGREVLPRLYNQGPGLGERKITYKACGTASSPRDEDKLVIESADYWTTRDFSVYLQDGSLTERLTPFSMRLSSARYLETGVDLVKLDDVEFELPCIGAGALVLHILTTKEDISTADIWAVSVTSTADSAEYSGTSANGKTFLGNSGGRGPIELLPEDNVQWSSVPSGYVKRSLVVPFYSNRPSDCCFTLFVSSPNLNLYYDPVPDVGRFANG